MAKKTINVRTNQKIDTTANWTKANLVLQKGEVGVEICSNGAYLIKIGDGISKWSALKYANGVSVVKWTN